MGALDPAAVARRRRPRFHRARRRNRPLAARGSGYAAPHGARARAVAAASRRSFGLRQPRAARRNVPALLHGRFCRGHPAARRRRAVCGRQPRGPPVAPALTSDRRAGRLDAADPPPRAAAARHADTRRSGVRSVAAGAARAGRRARRRPGPRAGSRAVACVPRSGASRGTRDQESADVDAYCAGSNASDGRTVGRSDGHRDPGTRGRDRSFGTAREGVLGVRAAGGRAAKRSRSRRAARRAGAHGRPRWRARHRGREWRTSLAVWPLRAAASRFREPLPQCRRGDERGRCDRRHRHWRPRRARRHDWRPRSRHPRRAAPARVRAVLHHKGRRHRPRPRAGPRHARSASRDDQRERDSRWWSNLRDRFPSSTLVHPHLMSPRVLLVDDESNIRRMVSALLQSDGYDTVEAADGNAAMVRLTEDAPDVVLLDLMMPPGPDGLATLEQIRKRAPHIPVVMMSGKANLADAVRATKLGAFQFLEKPLTPECVLVALRSALELCRNLAENTRLHEQLGHADPLVGTSTAMDELRALIARVAPTEPRVLITGESGTGKELVASAIQRLDARRRKAFVTVNSAAIPRDLVESDNFGHERGAFTGATERRQGRFELADGGTLFLDEVGDLGAEAQAKLLRVLETGVVERLRHARPFTRVV